MEREKFGEKIPQEKHRKTETDRDIQTETERKRTVTYVVKKHIISHSLSGQPHCTGEDILWSKLVATNLLLITHSTEFRSKCQGD